MLSNLDINYNCQDEKIFKAFFGSFFVYEDEDEEKEYYNFPRFMTATYLLANGSQEAKASAIFDIFSDCHGTIRLEKLESVITEIVEVVRLYTRRLLKVDASSLHLQEIKTRNKVKLLRKFPLIILDGNIDFKSG